MNVAKALLKRLCVLVVMGGLIFGITKAAVTYIETNSSSDSAGSVEVSSKKSDSYQQVVEVEEIPFKSVTKTTSALRAGSASLVQKGEVGEKTVTYEVTYEAGKEISRKKKFEKVIKRPKDEITVQGTLVPAQ